MTQASATQAVRLLPGQRQIARNGGTRLYVGGLRRSGCCRRPRAAAGYEDSSRNFRRLVAQVKAEWRRDHHRRRRPGVWTPGETLIIDWGVEAGLHVFCAVLAWSRFRFVRPFDDLGRANACAVAWCAEVNGAVHSEICAVPAERLAIEQPLLGALPSLRLEFGAGTTTRKVDKLSCVRFGSARYSVPCRLIGHTVTITTTQKMIMIIEPVTGEVLAEHQLVAPREEQHPRRPLWRPATGPALPRTPCQNPNREGFPCPR